MCQWKTCQHDWGQPQEIKDADFGVKFGEFSICKKCQAILHDDWTATRVGGVQRILPPETESK